MTVAVVVLNAAYVALLASAFTRALTWLRIMLVLAAIAFITFGLLEDILSMVLWNLAIGGMHAYGLVRDYHQQNSVQLSERERVIRDEFFPGLNDFDFNMLWCMGEPRTYEGNEQVFAIGELPGTVSLVLNGAMAIERDGVVDRGVGRGGLIGEMSHVSGQPSAVNVFTKGHVAVHQWGQRELAALDHVHPASARAFRQLLSRNLAAKVRHD